MQQTRRDRTLRREADMMAFTICIALLAALSYGRDNAPHTQLDVLVIVWGTTFGLALTHWFALTLSVRLVQDPSFRYSPSEMLVVQTMMAVLVATTATVAVLVVSEDFERLGARITAALFLGLLVGIESRASGSSRRRALGFMVAALCIGVSVAAAKWFIST